MNVNRGFSAMTADERAALETDAATGLKVVASAKLRGVVWLYFEDDTEAVRDADGNAAVWPE